ncbi:MAG: hypothetical protein ACR2JB_14435 [Bryobacteraceae bacterium]
MASRIRHALLTFSMLALLLAPLVAAEYYKLEGIKRIDQDLYRAGKILVETRYCYHYTYGETAILKYEGSGEYSGSKIIWEDETACDVRKVISE